MPNSKEAGRLAALIPVSAALPPSIAGSLLRRESATRAPSGGVQIHAAQARQSMPRMAMT